MYKTMIGFGIAGNFAHHLEQAGESEDFLDVEVDEKDAPKGIFPTYVPNCETFLGNYPFSNETISFLEGKNLQVEPEVALICDINYEDNTIKTLTPVSFTAYNDCSIRVAGAKKISHKKNWGKDSKGISDTHIDIDSFSLGGCMDDYSLVSYIKRADLLIQYGENSELLGYSYFYQRLQEWMQNKLNNQNDNGPLEDLAKLIKIANYPKQLLISIGATRYTDFGEKHFLEKSDIIYVVVYNHKKYSQEEISIMIKNDSFEDKNISILKQGVK